MAKGKWINKKQATTFQLVHRPQNDPLIHDESAPAMVLNPVSGPEEPIAQPVGKTLRDLTSELGSAAHIRKNEGEAATQGIYYDDTEYDYMQHIREIGKGAGEAVFIEANSADATKGKKKMNLVEALKSMEIAEDPVKKLDESILPSKNLQPINYQNQQAMPDAISGLQPDMDPRLREALEALDDDAYVDDEDFDLFDALTQDRDELDVYEFDETYDEHYGYEDGYESDGTAKPTNEYRDQSGSGPQIRNEEEDDEVPELVSLDEDGNAIPAAESSDWMNDFKQFKKDQKEKKKVSFQPPSEMQASAWTTTTSGAHRKRRKGALSTPSMTSMSSSVLVRTEQLELLDRRYEVLQNKEFTSWEGAMDDDVSMSEMSAMSTVSTVQGDVRQDFDNILDEFLGTNDVKPKGQSKKQMKKQRQLDGVARMDELRKSLGAPRIKGRY